MAARVTLPAACTQDACELAREIVLFGGTALSRRCESTRSKVPQDGFLCTRSSFFKKKCARSQGRCASTSLTNFLFSHKKRELKSAGFSFLFVWAILSVSSRAPGRLPPHSRAQAVERETEGRVSHTPSPSRPGVQFTHGPCPYFSGTAVYQGLVRVLKETFRFQLGKQHRI